MAFIIAYYYPPCVDNKTPLWLDIIKGSLYGITMFVWFKTQISIYRYHYPKQPKFMTVNP